jgi:glycosyltransferase involved in cell wall biosynthesis
VNPTSVSAVIPTYNRKGYIRRSINSVLAQTLPVDEVIVIDDGSTDGTAEAVHEWYGSRVRVVKQKNSGVSAARRRGVMEARGKWIAFLDSDDEWTPSRNRELIEAVKHVPSNVAWIFGDLEVVTDAERRSTIFEEYGLNVEQCPQVFGDALSVQYPFQFGFLQASLIRRSVLLELNCFSEGLHSSEDLLMGFQVACRYEFAAVPSVVGRYFLTSDLAASSARANGAFGPDYFRARMLAFALVMESGKRQPWNKRYASEARELCKVLAREGDVPRTLAMQQFRFGAVSLKGVAFFCAAMLGRRGILAWNAVAEFKRNRVQIEEPKHVGKENLGSDVRAIMAAKKI